MEEFSINSVTLHRRADRWYEVFVLIYCFWVCSKHVHKEAIVQSRVSAL